MEVLFATKTTGKMQTKAVKGDYTAREAVDQMLDGTGLTVAQDAKTGAFTISSGPNAPRAALERSSDRPASPGKVESGVLKLDKFEVMGTKLLNMDKPRSRDDAQPYVVFDRDKIEQSGAPSLEEFLKQRLTMNVVSQTGTGSTSLKGQSAINLRGLGTAQTLILVDGRRIAGAGVQGLPYQPDVNSIPTAAVERIEVLPTTASGIYGGGATGGVVNIILRRDYSGAEVKLTYDNSTDSDVGRQRIDFGAGLTLEGGKTNVLLTAAHAGSNMLFQQDRDFYTQGIALIRANNPAFPLPTGSALVPPLGSTPNIRSTTGANLTLKNGTALNSPITFVPAGYTGIAGDQGAALAANAGQYNYSLANTGQAQGGARADILGASTLDSLTATIRRQFSARFQAYVDASLSNSRQEDYGSSVQGTFTLQATSPINPFNQAIVVRVPITEADTVSGIFTQYRRVAAGVIIRLPADWMAAVDYAWNSTKLRQTWPLTTAPTAAAAVSAGTVNILRDPAVSVYGFAPTYLTPQAIFPDFASTSRNAMLRFAGPLATLPGGPITLSGSLEYRKEQLDSGTTVFPTTTLQYPDRSQAISSGYLETLLPLFSAANRKTGLEELELQLAARRDEYVIDGANNAVAVGAPIIRTRANPGSTDVTLGVRYVPVKSLMLRASYGTGFVPPSPFQLGAIAITGTGGQAIDPKRGNEPTVAGTLLTGGGNPNLGPEKSSTVSAGVVFSPAFAPGLRLSVDYSRIDKTDNILTLSGPQQAVNNEDVLSGRITRAAPVAGDAFAVGRITAIDYSPVNISEARIEAFDVAADYMRETASLGKIDLSLGATITPRYETQLLPTLPVVDNVGISGAFNRVTNPGITLKYKASAALTWTKGPWTLGWVTTYFDSYLVADPTLATSAATLLNQGNGGRVPRQIYHNVSGAYKISGVREGFAGGLFSNTTIQAGVRNVFHREPAFDASNTAAYYSPLGDPQVTSYYVSVKKTF